MQCAQRVTGSVLGVPTSELEGRILLKHHFAVQLISGQCILNENADSNDEKENKTTRYPCFEGHSNRLQTLPQDTVSNALGIRGPGFLEELEQILKFCEGQERQKNAVHKKKITLDFDLFSQKSDMMTLKMTAYRNPFT